MTVKQREEILEKMTKTAGRKPIMERPSVEELSELYSKMTAVEVGKHYGVPATTVRNWVAHYRKELKENK